MGNSNEPLYCPLCGTMPDVRESPERECPSCGLALKQIVWLERDRWTAIQGLVVLMRMAFDCGADSPEGCGTTDGQILDRIMATLEMLEAEVSGDLEGEATP